MVAAKVWVQTKDEKYDKFVFLKQENVGIFTF